MTCERTPIVAAPCPFCGVITGLIVADVNSTGDFFVICSWCRSTGPIRRDRISAIQAWNNRFPDSKLFRNISAFSNLKSLLANFYFNQN